MDIRIWKWRISIRASVDDEHSDDYGGYSGPYTFASVGNYDDFMALTRPEPTPTVPNTFPAGMRPLAIMTRTKQPVLLSSASRDGLEGFDKLVASTDDFDALVRAHWPYEPSTFGSFNYLPVEVLKNMIKEMETGEGEA